MRRLLVWACGGAAVLGMAVWLWPAGPSQQPHSASGGAAALPAPSTPASSFAPPVAPSGRDGAGSAEVARPTGAPATNVDLRALGTATAIAGGDHAAAARAAQEAARQRHEARIGVREEHRKEVLERAEKRRERVAARQAEQRAERATFEAMRAPDPNRPPPERQRLELGPAIVNEPRQSP